MRLVKDMYSNGSKLFGLCDGQVRADDHVHNGRWYNSQGERIGWGDLSTTDLRNIAVMLQEGEDLHVLREVDTSWNLPKGLDMDAPGMSYVLGKAAYTVKPGKLIVTVSKYSEYDQFCESWRKRYGDAFQGVELEFVIENAS